MVNMEILTHTSDRSGHSPVQQPSICQCRRLNLLLPRHQMERLAHLQICRTAVELALRIIGFATRRGSRNLTGWITH